VGQRGLFDAFRGRYQVHEFGWLSDDETLATLYQACDIFLMPSSQEAFGMMAIEAMSCGKPVLAIHGTALPSVIHSPHCGLAVEKAEFSAALQAWIDNEEERADRGKKSLKFAQENYSIERYMQGMMEIYGHVIRDFKPSINQHIVLSQLNYVTEPHYYEFETTALCHSRSWKATKPLRAFRQARRARGLKIKWGVYCSYMKQTASDLKNDETVKNSRSWKMTRPLRVAARIAKRIAKWYK
jgi:hypothetical protein